MLKNIINRSKEQPPPLGWASVPSKELSNLLHAHCRLRFRLWCSGHPHDSLDYRWVSMMLQGGVSRQSASQGLGNAVYREVSHRRHSVTSLTLLKRSAERSCWLLLLPVDCCPPEKSCMLQEPTKRNTLEPRIHGFPAPSTELDIMSAGKRKIL